MKKFVTIIISILVISVIAMCFILYHNIFRYNKHCFDNEVPNDFTLYMAISDVITKQNELGYYQYERDDFVRTVLIYENNLGRQIFRFDDDIVTSMQFTISSEKYNEVFETYGKPDKTSKQHSFNFWYGTIDGIRCYMCASYNSIQDEYTLEFGID